jgi:hypothetical protein
LEAGGKGKEKNVKKLALVLFLAAVFVLAGANPSRGAAPLGPREAGSAGPTWTFAGRVDSTVYRFSGAGVRAGEQRGLRAYYSTGDETLDIWVTNVSSGDKAMAFLRYGQGPDSRLLKVSLARLGASEEAAKLGAFLAGMDPQMLAAVREVAVESARLTDDSRVLEFLQLQIALLNSSGGYEIATEKTIWDCGPYAACYWGCVGGGGGWMDCGPTCNGGGAGEGRCY